jgi:hypothetical protein
MCSVVVNENFDPKEFLSWIFDFAYWSFFNLQEFLPLIGWELTCQEPNLMVQPIIVSILEVGLDDTLSNSKGASIHIVDSH